MSATISRTRRLGDWIGEHTNPLLVKEIRQALKSRQFTLSFSFVLLACWLISVGGTLLSGGRTMLMAANGKEFYYAYYGVLSFAIFVIVPFQAFRSLINERDQYTFELLSITTMKPGQIVRGKLCNALVQTCLFYSAIAPFLAMTNLLNGVSIPIIVFQLMISVLISSGLSMLALAFGAGCKNRGYQTGLTLVTLALLLLFWSTTLAPLLFMVGEGTIPFDTLAFWAWVAISLSYFATYFLLTLYLCISFLTFEADNRSTNVRICLMILFWQTFGWSIGGLVFYPSYMMHDFAQFLASFLAIHVLFTCFLICFEPDLLSRRVGRWVNKSRFRLLLMPLLPGSVRGLIFCYLHLAFSLCVALIFATRLYSSPAYYYVFGVFLYATIYVNVATLINRICENFESQNRPLLGRVLTVLACMLAALTPYIVTAFDRHEPSPSFCVSNPFATLEHLSRDHAESPVMVLILGVSACIAITLNVRAICRVIIDTMRIKAEPAREISL